VRALTHFREAHGDQSFDDLLWERAVDREMQSTLGHRVLPKLISKLLKG
jgi:hypothetical protein